CRTSTSIRPTELSGLDGFDRDKPGEGARAIKTLEGDRVVFNGHSDLYLQLPDGRIGGGFDSIRVNAAVFEGRTAEGLRIEAPVDQIQSAEIEQFSGPRTALLIVGTAAILAA